MAKPKNPFRVLGLDPNIIRTLNDDQIEVLVQAAFKSLQSIYHPDKPGGSVAKSKQINEARQLLDQKNKPEIYQALKAQFLRKITVSKQVAEAEANQQQAIKTAKQLNQAFLTYLIKAGSNQNLTVFNIPACTLEMRDYGADVNISFEAKNMSGRKKRQEIMDFLFYKMIIDEQRQLTRIQKGKTEKMSNRILIAAIPETTVKKHSSLINILRLMLPVKSPRHDYHLFLEEKPGKQWQEKEAIFFRNKIEPDAFKNIIHLVTPEITQGSYLFSLRWEGMKIYFSLEGCIQKIIWNNEDQTTGE